MKSLHILAQLLFRYVSLLVKVSANEKSVSGDNVYEDCS